MKALYILVLLAIAVHQVYPSSISNVWSSDELYDEHQSIVDRIVEAVEKIADTVGLQNEAETIKAIKRVAKDIDQVSKAKIVEKLLDINKKVLAIKRAAKQNEIEEVPCLAKIEVELKSHNIKTVRDFQKCTHELWQNTQGIQIASANIEDKLNNLKEETTDMIKKCPKEGPNDVVTCINRHILEFLREIRDLTNKLKTEFDSLSSKQREIIDELRQCNNQVLDKNEAYLKEEDTKIDNCSTEVLNPSKPEDPEFPENPKESEIPEKPQDPKNPDDDSNEDYDY